MKTNNINADLKKIRHFLKHHKNKISYVKILDGACGFYYLDEDRIEVDPTQDILVVIVHEILHRIYIYDKESKILKKERNIINNMTAKQAVNIIRML